MLLRPSFILASEIAGDRSARKWRAASAERSLRDAWARRDSVIAEIAIGRFGSAQVIRPLINSTPLPF
jgi:hypothetical protein